MDITPKAAKSKPACSSPCDSVESSPLEYKEENHHQKLSVPLKERLKRSRRSFTSPFSVAKRLCVEGDGDGQQGTEDLPETLKNNPVINPNADFVQQRNQLRMEVKDKMEKLRRLKLVKMYRNKNDLSQLQTLVDKWRSCAQSALYELQSDVSIHGGKASLPDLIDRFGLDDAILHFDRTEEDFTSQ